MVEGFGEPLTQNHGVSLTELWRRKGLPCTPAGPDATAPVASWWLCAEEGEAPAPTGAVGLEADELPALWQRDGADTSGCGPLSASLVSSRSRSS